MSALACVFFYGVPSLSFASQADSLHFASRLLSERDVASFKGVPVFASRLISVVCSGLTSSDVHLLSNRFKMGWVETGPVPAQVVDLHPFWDGAFYLCVRKTMGVESFGALVYAQRRNPVPMPFCAGPDPALVISADIFGKPFVEVFAGVHETKVNSLPLRGNTKGVKHG